jgi:trehalose synthase
LPPEADFEINALQRAATIVLQKSIKEGFGVAVSEAMWKGKPVIGSKAGGIAAQIVDGVTGYTVHSVEGAAFRGRYLLNNPGVIQRMGGAAREHVRRNFLVTRHLIDYLTLVKLFANR